MGASEDDVRGLRAYNELFDRARRMLRLGDRDAWVGESPSRGELEEMLGGERELTDIVFRASVADVLDEHFSDQRIKDALCVQGLIAAYGGPRDPGTAAVHLMHHMGDLGEHPGSWGYVTGGMGRISFAICEAAIEAGALIACGVPVAAIEPGRGVALEDGTEIRARSVLCNADPKVALDLLEEAAVPAGFEEQLREWKVRSPVMKLNAAVSELPRWSAAGGGAWPALGTVNVTGGLDACQEAFEACERGEVAVGFGEIYSQTASDASVAPEGKHVISVFAQYAPAEARRRLGDDAGLCRPRADRHDRAPRARVRGVDRGVRRAVVFRPRSRPGSASRAATSSKANASPTRCGTAASLRAPRSTASTSVAPANPPRRQRHRPQRAECGVRHLRRPRDGGHAGL